jgi:hypothetical protein
MSPEFEEWLKKKEEEDAARRDTEGDDAPELDAEDEEILDKAWEGVVESEGEG